MLKMREFRDYLRYARKYLLLANEKAQLMENVDWLLIPAIIMAWSAIEFFVNNRCDDLNSLPNDMFELHEKAFLQEKRLRFVDKGSDTGKFVLEGTEYQALENKIFFLLAKGGSLDAPSLKGGKLWQRFTDFKNVRDSLVHPRRHRESELNPQLVSDFIETAQEIIQTISLQIWNKELEF